MLNVTTEQLYHYLSVRLGQVDDEQKISEEVWDALSRCDVEMILVGSEMSENHLGGDDLVKLADKVVAAIAVGYKVVTWYGPHTEVLVAGVRPLELEVVAG